MLPEMVVSVEALIRFLNPQQLLFLENHLRQPFLRAIGKEVFETLDHALAIGKMVVIEGESIGFFVRFAFSSSAVCSSPSRFMKSR